MIPKLLEKHPKYLGWRNEFGPLDNLEQIDLNLKSIGFKFRVSNRTPGGLTRGDYTEYCSEKAKEKLTWADENLDDRWSNSNREFSYFQNKEDMLKFILKFGCKEIEKL